MDLGSAPWRCEYPRPTGTMAGGLGRGHWAKDLLVDKDWTSRRLQMAAGNLGGLGLD